jgi:hypothetical protein
VVTALLATVTASLLITMPAQATGTHKHHHHHHKHSGYWVTCKPYFRRTISGPWGSYIVRDDVFNIPGVRRAKVCIRHERGQPSFTVVSSNAYSPEHYSLAYPEVYDGCVYGACSPHTILPMEVSRIPRSFRFSAYDKLSARWRGGKFNTGFDIWFSRHRSTRGQAAGAEIMVWLYDRQVRFAAGWRTRIDGRRWLVEEWTTHNFLDGKSWPLIIFLRRTPARYAHRLHLVPFIKFAERHRWIRRHYWLESLAHGYELWDGGSRLSTTFFRVLP